MEKAWENGKRIARKCHSRTEEARLEKHNWVSQHLDQQRWLCQDMSKISERKNNHQNINLGNYFCFIPDTHELVELGLATTNVWNFLTTLEVWRAIWFICLDEKMIFCFLLSSEWIQASLHICSKDDNSHSLSDKLKMARYLPMQLGRKRSFDPYKDKESPGPQMDFGAVCCRLWQNFLSSL